MILLLLDANLLIYAHVSSMPRHRLAVTWLDTQLNAEAIVALPWQSLLSFVRLVTNPRIFERSSSIQSAWDQVESWLECPVDARLSRYPSLAISTGKSSRA